MVASREKNARGIWQIIERGRTMRVLLTGVGCPGAHALISNLKLQD